MIGLFVTRVSGSAHGGGLGDLMMEQTRSISFPECCLGTNSFEFYSERISHDHHI